MEIITAYNNVQGCSDTQTNVVFYTSPNCKGSNLLNMPATSADSTVTWSKIYLQHLRERERPSGLEPVFVTHNTAKV